MNQISLDAEKIGEGAKSEARTASMKEGMDAELGVFLGAKIRREEIGKWKRKVK